MSLNKFIPFRYINEYESFYSQSRFDDAESIWNSLCALGINIVTGSSGCGKTTLLKSAMKNMATIHKFGFEYVEIPHGSDLGKIESAYRLASDMNAFTRASFQSVGDITESDNNVVVQISTSATCEALRKELSEGLPRIVVFDQYERFFIANSAEAKAFIDTLRALVEKSKKVLFLICLEDTWLSNCLSIFKSKDYISYIAGIDENKAKDFVSNVSKDIAGFPINGALKIVESLDSDGGVWPLGLIACCQILEKGGARLSLIDEASINELIAEAVVSSFHTLPDYKKSDFILAVCAVAERQEVSPKDLRVYFPLRQLSWISQMLDNLADIYVLHKRGDRYSLAHDSIKKAVMPLRNRDDRVNLILSLSDNILEFRLSDLAWRKGVVEAVLRIQSAPPSLLFLAGVALFGDGVDLEESALPISLLKDALHRFDAVRVIREFDESLFKVRDGALSFESCLSVLFLDDRVKTVEYGLSMLAGCSQYEGVVVESWQINKALFLAERNHVKDAFNRIAVSNINYRVANAVFSRLDIGNPDCFIDRPLLRRCWFELPQLRPKILRHAIGNRDYLTDFLDLGLNDNDPVTRASAAHFLSENGQDFLLRNRIKKLLTTDEDVGVRRCAAYSMAHLLSEGDFADVMKGAWIEENSALVREAIVEAVNESKQRGFLCMLIKASHDSADYVRESAVFALFDIYGKASFPFLENCYQDSSPKVRDAMVKCFGLDGNSVQSEEYWNDFDTLPDSLKINILESCCATGNGEQRLCDVLAGRYDKEVTIAALQSAEKLRSEKCARFAASYLQSSDTEVLCSAITVVQNGIDNAEERAGLLIPLANHRSFNVRERVVYALGEIANLESRDALLIRLFDPEESIRIKTIYALAKLREKRAQPFICGQSGSEALIKAKEFFMSKMNS